MANYASIKLSTTFIDEARREADVLHRSVGAQVEYWAKLGRAIENTPGFGLDRVRETMEGRLRVEAVPPAEERERFFTDLSVAFDTPDVATQSHYAALGEREGAVGSDGEGGVIRRQPPVRLGASKT
jgi:hypothetical protein